MKLKKNIAVILAVLMLAIVLAGCATNGKNDNAGEGDLAPTATPTPDTGSNDDEEPAAAGMTGEIVVVSREDGSGTRGAFTELMGILVDDVDNTTVEATISNSTSAVMTTVAGNKQGIGYISLGSLNDTIKAVSVDGAAATVENIKSNSYPVFRNFNIATKGEVNEVTQDFIDFILSAEGQAVVEEEGFISAENTGVYEGKEVEGKIVVGGSTSVAPVMEKLQEAYNAINPNVEIEVHLGGSGTGMQQAMDGTLDIGMASRELKDSEKEVLDGIVIAIDGIAVIVNNDNPVDNLTSEQVRQIFVGEITTWDELN